LLFWLLSERSGPRVAEPVRHGPKEQGRVLGSERPRTLDSLWKRRGAGGPGVRKNRGPADSL